LTLLVVIVYSDGMTNPTPAAIAHRANVAARIARTENARKAIAGIAHPVGARVVFEWQTDEGKLAFFAARIGGMPLPRAIALGREAETKALA
jgi:hypothetical protein